MKINTPKISVIIPVYNQARFIEETILSVLNQDYPNLEFIIIDGGSNDGTQDIIEKYRSRLTYYISEPDEGMYDAIQKGFDKSTGEIMAWINADDLYFNYTFSVIREVFENHADVKWLMGLPSFFDEQSRCVGTNKFNKWSKIWALNNYDQGLYYWIQQESVFWKRELWEKSGGKVNSKFKYAGDLDLWLRFFDTGEQLFCMRTPLAGMRFHDQQKSLDSKAYLEEAKEVISPYLKKYRNTLNSLKTYDNLTSKIPVFRSLYFPLNQKRFNFPPAITYNREKGTFVKSN